VVKIYLEARSDTDVEYISTIIEGSPARGFFVLKKKSEEFKELGYRIKASLCLVVDTKTISNDKIMTA